LWHIPGYPKKIAMAACLIFKNQHFLRPVKIQQVFDNRAKKNPENLYISKEYSHEISNRNRQMFAAAQGRLFSAKLPKNCL
jgi:hypothetical protein